MQEMTNMDAALTRTNQGRGLQFRLATMVFATILAGVLLGLNLSHKGRFAIQGADVTHFADGSRTETPVWAGYGWPVLLPDMRNISGDVHILVINILFCLAVIGVGTTAFEAFVRRQVRSAGHGIS